LWDKLGVDAEGQRKMEESSKNVLPVGFVAGPEHIAEAYVYLVRADYATGTLVEIGKHTFTFCVFRTVG
jgi:hypothetical protein